jgi:carbon monoxide dehydrogenase subunit G
MELKGEYRIPAPRERVWTMLNDPAVLRECIPGCESLDGSVDEGFKARVTTKVGPVKATFNGEVSLTNLNPPESYTISGEGKGGVAGFAKGGADVNLAEDGGETVLAYTVNAQVGGKLAQLGSRLIDSTARKLADQFFSCFAAKAGAPAEAEAAAPAESAEEETVGHRIEEAVHEVEEEVESKAAMGFLGGPTVWGLLVILALLLVYVIAT